MELPILVCAEN